MALERAVQALRQWSQTILTAVDSSRGGARHAPMEVFPPPPFKPKQFKQIFLPIAWITPILSSPLAQRSILKARVCQNTISSQVSSHLPKWGTVLLQLLQPWCLEHFLRHLLGVTPPRNLHTRCKGSSRRIPVLRGADSEQRRLSQGNEVFGGYESRYQRFGQCGSDQCEACRRACRREQQRTCSFFCNGPWPC